MNQHVRQFFGGLSFFILGVWARAYRSAQLPEEGFRGHPLAAPEGGLPVEVLGWMGVVGLVLILLGLGFMGYTLRIGLKSGAIQAWIKDKLPEKKVEEEEPGEGEPED